MTTVTFIKKRGVISGFRVRGHSGYASAGNDIVCASISSAVWMVINGLSNVLGIKVKQKNRNGYVFCMLPENCSPEMLKVAQILLCSFEQLVMNMQSEYGKYIKLK